MGDPALPGSKPLPAFLADPEAAAAALAEEMRAAGIGAALAMGSLATNERDPLGIDAALAVAARLPEVAVAGVADPRRGERAHLERVEAELRRGRVKALKCYLGYLHVAPEDAAYRPYYELAAAYGLPVVFHTGDTYSCRAKVKYAHPLRIDEVAVDHPEVRFVMAHLGCPWFLDAAEVVFKNDNVWADLSGLLVGGEAYFRAQLASGNVDAFVRRLSEALLYSERWDRFLYGSDWPLAPLADYRGFVERVVPEAQRSAVFAGNARALFGL